MPTGPTRKHDFEKGKRQANAQKPEYQERFMEEGGNFDRGGNKPEPLMSFRGRALVLNLKSFYLEDKRSLIRTLERHWRFAVDGEVGTISQLLKKPKVAEHVSECFDIMARSIQRADEIIGVAEHPKTKHKFYTVEFRCPLRPEVPFPNPVFKKYLAFSAKLVGQAVDASSGVPITALSVQDGALPEASTPLPHG